MHNYTGIKPQHNDFHTVREHGRNSSPVSPCHLLTANRRLAVTVMMAGDVRAAWVLAAMWVTGEFDGNFSTIITSCCICSVNISGVCRRRYCSSPRDGQRGPGQRAEIRSSRRRARQKDGGKRSQSVLARKKTEGEGWKRRKDKS